ncbi:hypothetical protein [uncultured Arthrobacter sp.]|uniref:hypothetical protein n=1 Tax=uncultured Arthrobacter sp. TaxID=114050 RepID=UPI00262D3A16|nr:hypothetical protein [uncultured Arthrobacter sp.]
MSDTTVSNSPTAEQAKAMLDQASHLGASIRSSASWPAISCILGLGAVSSMALIAFTYANQIPGLSLILPMTVMGTWIIILLATVLLFSRSAKRGFGTRWAIYMGVWSILWAAGMGLSLAGIAFANEPWFTGLLAGLITFSTTACAWYEARQ